LDKTKFNADSKIFDYAVIGSSPLMLLEAISLAKDGFKVCILDRDFQNGGSWKTHNLENHFDIEIACHVIEVFPKVYDYLSESSGVPFVTLKEQPIRVNKYGFIFTYSSKILIILAGIRLLFGYIHSKIISHTSKNFNKNILLNYASKLESFWKYQTPIIFSKTEMKGPQFGFVDLLNNLVFKCESLGIEIKKFDVDSLHHKLDHWEISCKKGRLLSSKKISSTTSTNLRQKKKGVFESVEYKMIKRKSVVIEISKDDVFRYQSYVAFWKDPFVTRISRIDQKKQYESKLIYLVEIKNINTDNLDLLNKILRKALLKAKIIKKSSSFINMGLINCNYTENAEQLPQGIIDKGFTCYYSYGNLAAGIARWLNLKKNER